MTALAFREVEIAGEPCDVNVIDGRVSEMGRRLPVPSDAERIAGEGGALLPGLHDHHIHLAALAAARRSVQVGPPLVTDAAGLATALRGAAADRPAGAWVRAVGYHESVAGPLDRWRLDSFVTDQPIRLQHRSGGLWILNSRACELVGLDNSSHEGIEHDAGGRPNGRLYRMDQWLRHRMGTREAIDWADIGRLLAGFGVVGVTDATPTSSIADLESLAAAVGSGWLPLHVTAMGGPELATAAFPVGVSRGPVKFLLADHALPSIDAIVAGIEVAHRAGRTAALHCVTRESLILALAAWDEAGAMDGDRIEHAGIVPPEQADHIRTLKLTVVTQPGFVAQRGDAYAAEVDSDDLEFLYPCGSLLARAIPVGGSTDAPFADADPWQSITAAVERRTPQDRVLGASERIDARRALSLFLTTASAPGGPPRTIRPGASADLCLLDRPLADALRRPSADHVVVTVCRGEVTYRA
ncbi:MAG: amidohydrolase family protein [Acidimicrobiales bacterium]